MVAMLPAVRGDAAPATNTGAAEKLLHGHGSVTVGKCKKKAKREKPRGRSISVTSSMISSVNLAKCLVSEMQFRSAGMRKVMCSCAGREHLFHQKNSKHRKRLPMLIYDFSVYVHLFVLFHLMIVQL